MSYLPVDVRTLSSISEISLRKYIPDMTRMIPDTTMLGSLEDYMPHMSLTGMFSSTRPYKILTKIEST
jgi:hypothetical protein